MQDKNLLIGDYSIQEDLLDHSFLTPSNHSLLRSELSSTRYLNLKVIHDLQAKSVRHCLHNVMTSLSAMSGYLELIREHLGHRSGDEKLERYSEKIEESLNKVGFLLEQLHDLYKLENQNPVEAQFPEVNLNWIIEEITNIIRGSLDLTARKIICTTGKRPLFIRADLSRIKLIIYNMINMADQFCTENSQIEIHAEATSISEVRLMIWCTGETLSKPDIIQSFQNGLHSTLDEERPSVIDGLLIGSRLARQIGGKIDIKSIPGAGNVDGGGRQSGEFDRRGEVQSPFLICTLPLARV